MVHVICKMSIQPDQTDVFIEYADELIDATRKEAGCLKYELHRGEEDGIFFFIEDWKDTTELNTHMQSEHFTRLVPLMDEISAEEPRLELTTPLNAE